MAEFKTYNTATIDSKINSKQDTLVSGTNIKTINNQSLLGNGNLTISGGSSSSLVVARDVITISGNNQLFYIILNYVCTSNAYNTISSSLTSQDDLYSLASGFKDFNILPVVSGAFCSDTSDPSDYSAYTHSILYMTFDTAQNGCFGTGYYKEIVSTDNQTPTIAEESIDIPCNTNNNTIYNITLDSTYYDIVN